MPTFLVESYVAKGAAAPILIGSACGARHRWSLLVLDDDICFHLVDGPSAEIVREATQQLRCQRITEAVLIWAEDVARRQEKEET